MNNVEKKGIYSRRRPSRIKSYVRYLNSDLFDLDALYFHAITMNI